MENQMLQANHTRIQHKTFTRWVNTHLFDRGMSIESLETGFKDGVKLVHLLEIISFKEMGKYNKTPKMIVHRMENLEKALTFIKMEGITLVNIGAKDLEDGNLKITLGMVWTLILRYQINKGTRGRIGSSSSAPKQELMEWVNTQIKPYGQKTVDFNASYQNPRVLCSLVDSLAPGCCVVDDVKDAVGAIDFAMEIAHTQFNVPRMMDADDMAHHPDDLSIMTYISYFRDAAASLAMQANIAVSPDCRFAFTITGHDDDGNPLTSGGDDFRVTVEAVGGSAGKKKVAVKTKDNGDGTYTAHYSLSAGSAYKVSCFLNGGEVSNTPFEHDLRGAAA